MRRRKHPPNPSPQDSIARRAALYMRVSTRRQAEHDLSIPDPRGQLEPGCPPPCSPGPAQFIATSPSPGAKIKKKLALDTCEAETARLIFKLHLYGDGPSGALGVKEVVKWLTRSGYRTRRGDTFGVAGVHRILTTTVYMGQWQFNKASSRTGQRKPEEEVVTIPVPGLIEPQVFEQVQRQLHARSPQVVAPRLTTGPI